MNPVMSDLAIFVANHEAQVALETRQLVARGTGSTGPAFFARVTNVVNAIHQFLDPRGYAMAQLRQQDTVDIAPPVARAAAPITPLAVPESSRDLPQAA